VATYSPKNVHLSHPKTLIYDVDDEDDQATDEVGTNELQNSSIALNIRFNDKSIPENYRNSLFNVSPLDKIEGPG